MKTQVKERFREGNQFIPRIYAMVVADFTYRYENAS